LKKIEGLVPKENGESVSALADLVSQGRESQDNDTFLSKSSFDAALMAAGAVCKGVDLVSSGNYRNALCTVRPPGHHCGKNGHTEGAASQGYCILNNVAIGAFYAKLSGFQRVAVVDFDVHHGNGTEELLAGKPGFMFVSVHVGDLYPHTGKSLSYSLVLIFIRKGRSAACAQRSQRLLATSYQERRFSTGNRQIYSSFRQFQA
jgi:acetoin utilization deacetylase AcuC-like enzyme